MLKVTWIGLPTRYNESWFIDNIVYWLGGINGICLCSGSFALHGPLSRRFSARDRSVTYNSLLKINPYLLGFILQAYYICSYLIQFIDTEVVPLSWEVTCFSWSQILRLVCMEYGNWNYWVNIITADELMALGQLTSAYIVIPSYFSFMIRNIKSVGKFNNQHQNCFILV